ncbi:MAG: MotA/TolQ/ExbB proton channel family protein [Gammaproteobacteria bacterium]|nr:MotA/TolQ/ExbB proton channel family protein [Gammaproteobacteria bacterium]
MNKLQSSFELLLNLGGPVVLILLVFSVIGTAVILLKFWQFYVLRLGSSKFADDALQTWRRDNQNQAIDMLEGNGHPVAKVLHTAFVQSQARLGASIENAREETLRVARLQLENLRSHMRMLEVIAALSPLLGLLGTVLGMIKVFRELELAGSKVDPSILSGGIWEALLTTALGLSIAIPAVLMVNYFDRVIDRTRHRMEDSATQVFTGKPSAAQTPATDSSMA